MESGGQCDAKLSMLMREHTAADEHISAVAVAWGATAVCAHSAPAEGCGDEGGGEKSHFEAGCVVWLKMTRESTSCEEMILCS